MKFSIITPTFNSEKTISKNINSIISQSFKDWEQIIIDNSSTDNTIDLVKKFKNTNIKIISEKDDGIYNAINKGILNSKGEIISILHSDDYFHSDDVLNSINDIYQNRNIDIVYGDLLYVNKNYKPLRYWKSNKYHEKSFLLGWSPPHPSFFVKKKLHDLYGLYSENLGNPADFEMMYRFLYKNNISNYYFNKILVEMRYGGVSNNKIFNIISQNITILKILNIHLKPVKVFKFLIFKIINRLKQFKDINKVTKNEII